MRRIPKILRDLVEDLPDTQFDRAHFSGFGDFSLNFECVYFVLSADYNLYMDKQQSINLRLLEVFEEEKIEFAYPTQKLLFQVSALQNNLNSYSLQS